MHAIFWVCIIKYPNQLVMSTSSGSLTFLISYMIFSGLSIYYFLTSGLKPGYLDETETPRSKKEKAQLFVRNDEFQNISQNSSTDEEAQTELQMDTCTDSKDQSVKNIEYVCKVELPEKRFCEFCNQDQPYRTKHCKECERCVRKYDHHCFWIGGCVGELNHGKFWLFLFFQTISLLQNFHIAMTGYGQSYNFQTEDMRSHVQLVWGSQAVLVFLFALFTGILMVYHGFLIASGQTTWEHSRREQISYLKIYPRGVYPFHRGVQKNIESTFQNGGECRDWELKQPFELKEIQGFNIFENELWSCC